MKFSNVLIMIEISNELLNMKQIEHITTNIIIFFIILVHDAIHLTGSHKKLFGVRTR